MPDEQAQSPQDARRSASAEAAALRWAETHPDEDLEPPPVLLAPEDGAGDDPAPRRSASAEAAALRWSEQEDEAGV